jgi:hypothetical protein
VKGVCGTLRVEPDLAEEVAGVIGDGSRAVYSKPGARYVDFHCTGHRHPVFPAGRPDGAGLRHRSARRSSIAERRAVAGAVPSYDAHIRCHRRHRR